MIKHIHGANGIQITGMYNSMPYISTSALSSGQLRWNGSNNHIEVYDGVLWHAMPDSSPTISLDDHTKSILRWAEEKMQEEHELKKRMEQHPGLRDAYEQFKVMDALILEEKQQGVYRRA